MDTRLALGGTLVVLVWFRVGHQKLGHELLEFPGAAKPQPNLEVHRRDAEGAESYWTRILADSHSEGEDQDKLPSKL